MPSWKLVNAELIAWCAAERGRIERGESRLYHAVLCDPPYGLEFMGKEWDKPSGAVISDAASVGGFQDGAGGNPYSRSRIRIGAGTSFQSLAQQWGEALKPLLHPGALVFMFAGTRMWHRLAAGMEDAGFQMWDTLLWLHGQGFPKAQAIDALIDKARGDERPIVGSRILQGNAGVPCKEKGGTYGTLGSYIGVNIEVPIKKSASEISAPWAGHKTAALKPAWEPVLCFRAPDDGRIYADLALAHGSGALNIDGARIGTEKAGWGGKAGKQPILVMGVSLTVRRAQPKAATRPTLRWNAPVKMFKSKSKSLPLIRRVLVTGNMARQIIAALPGK